MFILVIALFATILEVRILFGRIWFQVTMSIASWFGTTWYKILPRHVSYVFSVDIIERSTLNVRISIFFTIINKIEDKIIIGLTIIVLNTKYTYI